MEHRRFSKRKFLRDYNVPVEDYIEAGDYSVSPIYKLPDHLILRIFSYLSLRDRIRLQRVSKFWQKLCFESWKSYKTLTFSLEDWGHYLTFNSSKDKFLVLKNILKAYGSFITCLDLRRSSRFTVWQRNLSDSNDWIVFPYPIGNDCPNLATIHFGNVASSRSILTLLNHTTKLQELTMCSKNNLFHTLVPTFKRNENLRKLVLHIPLHSDSWIFLNPEAVEEIDTFLDNINNKFCSALIKWINLKSITVLNNSTPNSGGYTEHIKEMLESLMSVEKSLKRIVIKVTKTTRENAISTIDPKLIEGFKNIETLEFNGRELHLSKEFFETVGKNCINLTRIHLSDLENINDVTMMYIVELPKLEELELNFLDTVSDMIFINNLLALKKLRCVFCQSLKAFGLCEFMQSSKTIESIEIMHCTNFSIEKVFSETKSIIENRLNGPLLRIIIERTQGSLRKVTKFSKFLEIIEC